MTGSPLEIVTTKWANGSGAAGTDRMVCYSQDYGYVRFPMTEMSRMPLQFDGTLHKTTYYARLGQVEIIYPELVGYRDGI
jgi:hypothetical protein